ncbi:MAG: Nif3-like dinuclear metal center hexameric protein [Polyangiaceae bacterium]
MSKSLAEVVRVLERLAPTRFAEDWDNVGLLVEPTDARPVTQVLFTIDLTEPVFAEALSLGAELIVAYHPPIFRGLKRLTQRTPIERVVTQALAENIAIYSPHTALDAAPGGVNDWLCDVLGAGEQRPIQQTLELDPEQALKLVTFIPTQHAEGLRLALGRAGAGHIGNYFECAFSSPGHGSFRPAEGANPYIGTLGETETVEELRVEMVCARKHLAVVSEALRQAHPYEEPAWEVYALEPRPRPGSGMGRLHELSKPATLAELVNRVKVGLGLEHIRVAASAAHRAGQPISRAAVCAGAGGSLFEKLSSGSHGGPELFFTGEMRHHDVLARVASGSSVILCDHTNTERGYLPHLAQRVRETLPDLELVVSQRDRDPLEVV